MLKSLSVCVVFLLPWTVRATAQNYQYIYGTERKIAALAKQPSSARALDSVEEALDIGDGTNVSKLLFFAVGYKRFLQEVENARTDKQTGAAPSSQGTTSMV